MAGIWGSELDSPIFVMGVRSLVPSLCTFLISLKLYRIGVLESQSHFLTSGAKVTGRASA